MPAGPDSCLQLSAVYFASVLTIILYYTTRAAGASLSKTN